jgi:MFS family permease
MARVHGWSAGEIGLTFGTILLLTSGAAVIGHGWILARLFAAGRNDIHLRWQLLMSGLSIPAFALAYLGNSPLAACVGFGLASLLSGGAVVAGPTVLQIATPAEYRGRISAIYVVLATLLGTAAGPAAIGLVTDLLGDERQIGVALAACCSLFCLGAAGAFALGLPAARRIIAQNVPRPSLQA